MTGPIVSRAVRGLVLRGGSTAHSSQLSRWIREVNRLGPICASMPIIGRSGYLRAEGKASEINGETGYVIELKQNFLLAILFQIAIKETALRAWRNGRRYGLRSKLECSAGKPAM